MTFHGSTTKVEVSSSRDSRVLMGNIIRHAQWFLKGFIQPMRRKAQGEASRVASRLEAGG
jgi:hypothetical protein